MEELIVPVEGAIFRMVREALETLGQPGVKFTSEQRLLIRKIGIPDEAVNQALVSPAEIGG